MGFGGPPPRKLMFLTRHQSVSVYPLVLCPSPSLLVSVNLQVLLVERGGADLEGGPAVLASS